MVVGMSTKPIEPELDATPEVVVENLRAAVYASHEEISVQVQADGGLDSKLLGLLGFFALAGSILVTVPHGLSDRRGATMRRMGKLSPPLLPSGLPAESVPTGPSLGLWELLQRLIKSRAADAD
jgi:hypothetical protein